MRNCSWTLRRCLLSKQTYLDSPGTCIVTRPGTRIDSTLQKSGIEGTSDRLTHRKPRKWLPLLRRERISNLQGSRYLTAPRLWKVLRKNIRGRNEQRWALQIGIIRQHTYRQLLGKETSPS